MNNEKLQIQNKALLEENIALKAEIARLKKQLNPFENNPQPIVQKTEQFAMLPTLFDIADSNQL